MIMSHAIFPFSKKVGVTCNVSLQYERQHEKEQTQEMTEKLDQEWKDIRLSMGISKV